MDHRTATFARLRRRLHGIGYRMLGTQAEADDVVQDAWLRWHAADASAIDNDEAWLVSVTTRLAIDRLRALKARREDYVGMWLPEPELGDAPATPEQMLERADEVSFALLTALERLSPEARAAFLLREVFDLPYDEVAQTLQRSEAACRQLVHRARTQVRESRPRQRVDDAHRQKLLQGFADAATRGDFGALKQMLAEDAQLIGDGGGVVPSFGVPMLGGQRIAQLYLATSLRYPGALQIEVVRINGEWGLLRHIDGALESVQAIEFDGERIVRIHAQRNPHKLAAIAAQRGTPLQADGGGVSG
ncbi:MAG: RNA polymerase sigma-70 factor [Hydrogenophaga sp.]|uniref:RNA polymerase sigma-70 factor n=1 Tax=Hydrogenophaga sp. TaxID=1904254 RepID=UPI001E052042|nr:RNA polymerase sigma-70 factor [Hydrogenophaga sp.]MBX3610490.1 RNA polymerase sigma-70 factor [Hydrogenophaga sp.]